MSRAFASSVLPACFNMHFKPIFIHLLGRSDSNGTLDAGTPSKKGVNLLENVVSHDGNRQHKGGGGEMDVITYFFLKIAGFLSLAIEFA